MFGKIYIAFTQYVRKNYILDDNYIGFDGIISFTELNWDNFFYYYMNTSWPDSGAIKSPINFLPLFTLKRIPAMYLSWRKNR